MGEGMDIFPRLADGCWSSQGLRGILESPVTLFESALLDNLRLNAAILAIHLLTKTEIEVKAHIRLWVRMFPLNALLCTLSGQTVGYHIGHYNQCAE